LLDTHIFLWAIKNDRRLPKTTRSKILDASDVYINSASIWEVVIKVKLKELDADIDLITNAISESGFSELPVTARHAATVSRLSDIHRDPFDRILIAQAISEPLTFLTADAALKDYSDLVEVVNAS
jgi:PIN domain nuclease of toxin-antitoxin system